MKSVLAREDDGTIQLTISIPKDKVTKTQQDVVEEIAKNANIPGFRKGKAPKKIVEDSIDKARVKEEVLKKLLPQSYLEAVQEHNLKPIINPKIHVEKLEDGTDWEFKAITCELPEINLNDYKDKIKSITAKSKILIPGKEQQDVKFDDIVQALLDSVQAQIPQIFVDQEVERLLAQLLDEVKKLGLTLDQYLQSSGKTPEQLRKDYETKAVQDIKLEFALQKIAEAEKIIIDPKEIDEAILKAPNDSERKNLEANKYLLSNILRQQKTLDFLKNL